MLKEFTDYVIFSDIFTKIYTSTDSSQHRKGLDIGQYISSLKKSENMRRTQNAV